MVSGSANIPALTRYDTGNPVTDIQGQQFNTMVQGGGALFSDLRGFIAAPGMIVLASGSGSINDGSQGFFQFVQLTGNAMPPADDNFTVLWGPVNVWPRCYWQRVPIFLSLNVYDIAMNYSQVPPPSVVFLTFVACRRFTTPINLTASQAVSVTGPTTTMSYSLLRNAVQFGTVTFVGGGGAQTAGTFIATAQTWAPGDILEVSAPVATYGSANVAITIEGNAF